MPQKASVYQRYFNAEHDMIRQTVHRFVQKEIAPFVDEWEEAGEFTCRVAAKMNAGLDQVKEIPMAKNFACQVSNFATYEAVQIFGGYGCMREYLVERLYRDNRILSIGGGTTEIMKEIIGKRLFG